LKSFACGDVVPGCEINWECETDDEILHRVAAHASADHGLADIPPELVSAVRAKIKPLG
jgi:predicted small metal-binding protein